MTEAIQTVIVATGDASDQAAMLAEVGPLSVEAIHALVGREDAGVVEPSFDDDGRWVFPGSARAALSLVKALSVKYPTLEWFLHLPTPDGSTYDYSLIAGEGIEEKRAPYTSIHSHLPVGEFVIYRARVGKSSHVLSAVYVIADGQAIDVTDTHLPRSGASTVRAANADDFDHYDEDGIDLMLAQAH